LSEHGYTGNVGRDRESERGDSIPVRGSAISVTRYAKAERGSGRGVVRAGIPVEALEI
jgi:hypothetical protein